MKKLTIVGERQMGKTSFLVNSIVSHLTDIEMKDDAALIVSAPAKGMIELLKTCVVEELKKKGIKFSHTQNLIYLGSKTCRFINPQPWNFIELQIDYIFLDNIEMFPKTFASFVDTMLRPNVVVIQTHNASKELSKYLEGV